MNRHHQSKYPLPWGYCPQIDDPRQELGVVAFVRGTVRMHEIQAADGSDDAHLIHSTDLRNHRLCGPRRVRRLKGRVACGPMVLLPRVGQPNNAKVVRYLGSESFLLPDCVIALILDNPEEVDRLWNRLQDKWTVLAQAYVGSGARYVTLRRLCSFLNAIGYSPAIRQSHT